MAAIGGSDTTPVTPSAPQPAAHPKTPGDSLVEIVAQKVLGQTGSGAPSRSSMPKSSSVDHARFRERISAFFSKAAEPTDTPAETGGSPIKKLAAELVEDTVNKLCDIPTAYPYMVLRVKGQWFRVEQRGNQMRILGPGGNEQKVMQMVLEEAKNKNTDAGPFDSETLESFIRSAAKGKMRGVTPEEQIEARHLAEQVFEDADFQPAFEGCENAHEEIKRLILDTTIGRVFQSTLTQPPHESSDHQSHPSGISLLGERERKIIATLVDRHYTPSSSRRSAQRRGSGEEPDAAPPKPERPDADPSTPPVEPTAPPAATASDAPTAQELHGQLSSLNTILEGYDSISSAEANAMSAYIRGLITSIEGLTDISEHEKSPLLLKAKNLAERVLTLSKAATATDASSTAPPRTAAAAQPPARPTTTHPAAAASDAPTAQILERRLTGLREFLNGTTLLSIKQARDATNFLREAEKYIQGLTDAPEKGTLLQKVRELESKIQELRSATLGAVHAPAAVDTPATDAEGQYQQGVLLAREGRYVEAKECFEMAIKQQHGRAELCLGYMYDMGLGVEQQSRTAVRWYTTSKEHLPGGEQNVYLQGAAKRAPWEEPPAVPPEPTWFTAPRRR